MMPIGDIAMHVLSSNVRKRHRRHRELRTKQTVAREPYTKNIVFFTGAGISAESGIATFRGENGLWTDPKNRIFSQFQGVKTNLEGFLSFHNQRRREMCSVEASIAHRLIADLQESHCVRVITQNIDDLHERAGSQHVVHLHGSILHMRPQGYQSEKYRLPWLHDIKSGDRCPSTGAQLRPDIVLFGERVYDYYLAREWLCSADVLVVIGTSLLVEPAASLLCCVYPRADVFYINVELLPEDRLPLIGKQYVGTANAMMELLYSQIKQPA